MGKHSEDAIITRQGEKIMQLEEENKRIFQQLLEERTNRISDLREINRLASCNDYMNPKGFLKKIDELTSDRLIELTQLTIKKELTNTDQSE